MIARKAIHDRNLPRTLGFLRRNNKIEPDPELDDELDESDTSGGETGPDA